MSLSRVLSYADFSGRQGEQCIVELGEHRVPLALEKVEELPGSQRETGGFRLLFVGPVEQALMQGIYAFRFGEELFELFIVPLGPDRRGMHYEAVFY